MISVFLNRRFDAVCPLDNKSLAVSEASNHDFTQQLNSFLYLVEKYKPSSLIKQCTFNYHIF